MSAISTSKKALVLGRGKSGEAAARVLAAQGLEVEFADDLRLVVASPGIQVKSELELGCELLKARGVRLLAVTGSKGKSSVVKLVADALNANGRKAVACGNYGLPVCAAGDCDWAVVEVSSFQLETTSLAPDTFEAAVVLNLQEDHLDRHGSAGKYHALKNKLLGFAKKTPGTLDGEELVSGYFGNPVLMENAKNAIFLMRVAGLDEAAIARAFREFEPLPHRMNLVGEFGGVRAIDDSKATNMAALCAGIEMAGGKVRLIAGGLGKGDDPRIAIPLLTKRVKKVYIIGTRPEKLLSAWSGCVECEVSGDLATAVARAMREAAKGDTVLLSPGAASFDQFASFGERGDAFARLVKQEGQNK